MSITSYRCPHCGADLSFSESDFTVCPYCDSHIVIEGAVGKDELERLRVSQSQLARKTSTEAEYYTQLKKWRFMRAGFVILLGAIIIAAFLLVEYISAGAGTLVLILGVGVFAAGPLIVGPRCPLYDYKNSTIEYGKHGTILKLYLLGVFTIFVAMVLAAILVVTVIGRNEEDEESASWDYSAAMQSEDCDILMSKWADSMFDKNGGDVYYSALIPASVADEVKSDSTYKELVSMYKQGFEEVVENRSYRVVRITRLDALTDNELIGAENYFSDQYGGEFTAMQGYEYDITIERKDKSSGSKDEFEAFACAVKLKGDGWTIIDDDKSLLRDFM